MRSVREVLRGNLLVFTLGDAMRQLSLFITFPYFSLYIQALGGSKIDIGLVNGLRPLAALFVYPVAGYLADRYSRVKIIVASSFATAGILVVFALAPGWGYLALGNLLMGLVVFQFPAMNSLMADSIPRGRRGLGYSLWIALPSALGIVAPFIGGYLITSMGVDPAMRSLYWFTILATLAIGAMNLRFLEETRGRGSGAARSVGLREAVSSSYRGMLGAVGSLPRGMKAFALMLVVSFFINSLVAPFWVVYGVEAMGLTELQWGTVLLIAAASNVALLVPAGVLVDRFEAKRVLTAALALSAAPLLLFPYSGGFTGAALVFVAMTVANVFLTAGAPAFMADNVPPEMRGRVMAALGQGMLYINTRSAGGGPGMGAVLTVPSILGSVLGGFVYDLNPALPWVLFSASMVLNASISAFLVSSRRKESGS